MIEIRGMIEATLDGPPDALVGRIVLNRPEAHNALDRAGIEAFGQVLADWEGRDDLRAVLLTGRGRSFCAGASLGEVAGGGFGGVNPLTTLCDRLDAFPVPVVAGLNGGVYGGGVELALACDFRVGVEGMRAFVPPARLGILCEPRSSLPRRCSRPDSSTRSSRRPKSKAGPRRSPARSPRSPRSRSAA